MTTRGKICDLSLVILESSSTETPCQVDQDDKQKEQQGTQEIY